MKIGFLFFLGFCVIKQNINEQCEKPGCVLQSGFYAATLYLA